MNSSNFLFDFLSQQKTTNLEPPAIEARSHARPGSRCRHAMKSGSGYSDG